MRLIKPHSNPFEIRRDAIQALSDDFNKSVIVVDTSNEIAGRLNYIQVHNITLITAIPVLLSAHNNKPVFQNEFLL